jgi:hypothetical protein
MVDVRVADDDRMNSSLASLGKIRTSLKEIVQISYYAPAVSVVTGTFTTGVYQHRIMLKFQEYRFSLAHVDEVDLVPWLGCGITRNT